MTSLQEAASGLLNAVESAIESGGWKVDGACDPSVEIIRLKNALAKPQKEWVGLTDVNEMVEAELTHYCNGEYDYLTGARNHLTDFAQAIEAKLREKNS